MKREKDIDEFDFVIIIQYRSFSIDSSTFDSFWEKNSLLHRETSRLYNRKSHFYHDFVFSRKVKFVSFEEHFLIMRLLSDWKKGNDIFLTLFCQGMLFYISCMY